MSEPTTIKELIPALEALEREVGKLPDSQRLRAIGCAIQAARRAIVLDKPKHEIKGLIKTSLEMADLALEGWAEEEGL